MKNQSISTYYATDHDRLDELFKDFQRYKRIDFPQAREFFRQFKLGLQRHIVWEEEILFPLFEQKTCITQGGPTEVMRNEHRLIKKYLEAIHQQVELQNPNSDEDEQMLLNTLFLHNQKEEKILYPAIDGLVSAEERESIFTSMETVTEEQYGVCCKIDLQS